MQPYFLPYLGYYQLINAVDTFVIYDNIEFTKKGWINRNRFILNGKDKTFTLPLKSSSDYLSVNEKFIADNFPEERTKILNQVKHTYHRSPYFPGFYPVLENILLYENRNLFDFIYNALQRILDLLNIRTKIVISSSIPIDHSIKSENKVLAICKALHANTYINPIGGVTLYEKDHFMENGITLRFHKMNEIKYPQQTDSFISHLSIIDVLMNNSTEQVKEMLQEYTLN